jgi:hypothetical protein
MVVAEDSIRIGEMLISLVYADMLVVCLKKIFNDCRGPSVYKGGVQGRRPAEYPMRAGMLSSSRDRNEDSMKLEFDLPIL